MAVTHRSLSIAVESSFGSLDATTGLPSTAGLTLSLFLVKEIQSSSPVSR
jgi:hypothetical protein